MEGLECPSKETDLREVRSILMDSFKVKSNTKEYQFYKIHLNVNYGLQTILIGHCRFINCNKYTTIVGACVSWGRWCLCRGKGHKGTPNFPLNFSVKPQYS